MSDLVENIDANPFSGTRDVGKRRVVLRDFDDKYFHNMSLLGSNREKFYQDMRERGIVLNKIYIVEKIEGYGDVYDVFVRTDTGKVEQLMGSLFETAKEASL